MGNRFKNHRAHSAEAFGDTRDHWWNLDFLRLMAERWELASVRDVLDVGCGVGHWGTLLATVLPEDARFTGLDREPAWVNEASARARAMGLGARFAHVRGAAERLPFPDDRFDLTTCQTVLIHVADPSAVLREMMRVTKPGGLIAVAEPNNLTAGLLLDSISNASGINEIVEWVRLQLTCERGKAALGEGDNSLGDRVPGLFATLGLRDIEVYENDRASAVFPPYAIELQRAGVDELRDQAARRIWIWDEAQTRRYFVAGGGVATEFDALFERVLAARARIIEGIDEHRYHGVLGGAFFLVGGRKGTPDGSAPGRRT